MLLSVYFASHAQQVRPQPKIGIKAAANRSEYVFKNIENITSSLATGFSLSGFINFKVSEKFSFQHEMELKYKVSEIDDKQANKFFNYKSFSFDMPVYAMINYGKMFSGAGVTLSAGVSAGAPDYNVYEKEVISPIDFGFAVITGYDLSNHMQFFAGYQRGLVNLIDVSRSNAKMKSRSFSAGIAYKFKSRELNNLKFIF